MGKEEEMAKLSKNILLIFSILVISSTVVFAEDITITTYYPSPYGSYQELRSQREGIGTTYYNRATVCWDPPCPVGSVNVSVANPSLLVEGNVGIGTMTAGSKLVVQGSGATSATIALTVQNSAGSVAMSVLNNGKVGIGTLIPKQTLSVGGDGGGIGVYGIFANSSTSGIYATGNDVGLYGVSRDVGTYGIGNKNGIGTYGSGNTYGVYGSGGLIGVYGNASTYDFYAGNAAAKSYFSGKVGIGSTMPGAKLDVNGDIKISGGNPGVNKVLTSDANGLASWQTSAAGLTKGIQIYQCPTTMPALFCNNIQYLRNGIAPCHGQLYTYSPGGGCYNLDNSCNFNGTWSACPSIGYLVN